MPDVQHNLAVQSELHVPHMTYAGSPNGIVTGLLNQICYDTTNFIFYINIDGDKSWLRINLNKATGAELDTGTDDAKFATAKAIKDAHNVPSVVPSTDGNVMTSDGTDWVSETPAAGGSIVLSAVKTADETVNNSTTYQDDDHLSLTVSASTTYIFELTLICSVESTASIKTQMVLPGDGTADFIHLTNRTNANTVPFQQVKSGTETIVIISGYPDYSGPTLIRCLGIIIITTAGTVKLQWAQSISQAVDTKILKGSFMKLTKVQ